MLFIKWFVFINDTILYLFILLYWLQFSRCSSQTLLCTYIHTHTHLHLNYYCSQFLVSFYELWAKLCIFYDFMFNPCLVILKVVLNASLASLSCSSYVLFFLCGQPLMNTCRQNNKILLAILTMTFWICMTWCLQLYDWCYAKVFFPLSMAQFLSARCCYHWLPPTSQYSFTLSYSPHYQRCL